MEKTSAVTPCCQHWAEVSLVNRFMVTCHQLLTLSLAPTTRTKLGNYQWSGPTIRLSLPVTLSPCILKMLTARTDRRNFHANFLRSVDNVFKLSNGHPYRMPFSWMQFEVAATDKIHKICAHNDGNIFSYPRLRITITIFSQFWTCTIGWNRNVIIVGIYSGLSLVNFLSLPRPCRRRVWRFVSGPLRDGEHRFWDGQVTTNPRQTV